MSRNGMTPDEAFASLRDSSRSSGTKLADVAAAVVGSHRLFGTGPTKSSNVPTD